MAETIKEGRKPEYPEKTLKDELQKIPNTKARIFKPQVRLKARSSIWWQARTVDMLTITPGVAPVQIKLITSLKHIILT